MSEEQPIADVAMINPKPQDGRYQVLVLETVGVSTPAYQVCGKVTCDQCDDWCWLGTKSYPLIMEGKTLPLCLPCATKMGVAVLGTPVMNVGDES